MDEQLLKDFLATAQANKYDWEVIMPKFPELADVDLQVLKDYAETAKQNNYDYAVTNPLFPELFPQDPLKKKDVTESSGKNGSLVSPTITNTPTQTTDASVLQQNALQASPRSDTAVSTLTPPPSVPETEGTESITPELMTYEEEFVVPQLNYEYGNQGFIFEESGAFGDSMKVTAENGETLDVNLDVFLDSTKTKEAAALKDFIVKNKTRRGLNQMESEYISAQKKFYNEEEVNTAVTKIGEQTLGYVKQVQEYLADKAKLDEEMAALSSLTAQQRSSKGKEISAVMERSKELRELKKQLIKGQSVLVNNERNLKVAAGKYFDMLAEQGTVGGASYNRILKGIGRIAAGATSYAVDALVSALPYAGMNPVEYRQMFVDIAREKGLEVPENFKNMTEDELKEFYSEVARTEELTTQSTTGQTIKVGEKKITFGEEIEAAVYDKGKKTVKFSDDVGLGEGQGLLEAIRTGAPTLLGDKNVSEQYDQLTSEGFWGGAWLGLMESIPAMIAPGGAAGMAARTAMMFSQVSDHYDEEMENNPEFKDISENERAAFKLPVGIVVGALEAIGVRNALRQSPFLNKLLLRIAGKTPKNVTGKTFNDIVRNEINNMFAKGTIVVTAAGLAEFETGALQEVADISAKKVYNAFKEKEMFVTPESFSEGVSQVLVAGAQEAVGGFVIGTPGAIVAAATTQDFTQVDDATFEMFEILTSQDNSSKFTYAEYKNKVANPNDKMTKEEAEAEIALFEEVQGLVKQIPTDLSTEQKKKALGLMLNRKQLEDSKAGKDSSLTQNIDKKIGEIDQQLNNILFTKEAESAADAIPEMEKEKKGTVIDKGKLSEEQQDIDSFFGEDVEETTETVQSNLSINRAGDVTEKSPETISRENAVIKLAKLGAKSISTLLPNTRIILHESNTEFEKYGGPGRAELIGDTIHINLSKATSTTVPHEIFHAVFLSKIKTDPRASAIAEGMMKAVRKTLPDNSDLAKRIDAFADSYKDVSELQNEERLAELIGIMASEYKTLSKPQKNIVVKFIEDLARVLGIDVNISEFTKTDADVIDLLNTLAVKVGSGQVITQQDVEILEGDPAPPVKKKGPARRQQRNIEQITQQYNMNTQGFIPKSANLSQLRKIVEPLGFEVLRAKEDQYGRGGGLYLKQNGKRYKPPVQGRRQQRSVIDYVNEGRDAGFRDELIIDYLRRVRRLKMKDIKKVMDIPAGVTMSLPESFKNIKGGAVAGLKLFKKIEAFRDKERTLNKRRKNKLSEAQIMTKAIEFLQSQPEYKNEGDTFVSKGKVRFKTGISTQQVLLENDLQKTLDQRPTEDMARRLKLARAMVTQRVKGKRDLQAIKKEVRSFIRKTLPVDMYRLSEVKSLINEVTEATEENIENVLDKVLDLATTKNNKSLDSKIKKLLNNDFITNRFGRKVGKSVDQSTRDRLVAIKKALANKNATEEEIDKINESLNKQFNELLLDADPSQDVVNKMIDLQIAININNAQKLEDTNVYKTEALDSALVELVGLVGQGRTLLQQELDRSAKGYRDQMSKVYEAITGQKIDLEADDAKEILEKQKNARISEREKNEVQKRIGTAIKNIFSKIEEYIFGSAEAIDGLMDRIDKLPGDVFGGVTQRLVTDKVDRSTRVYKERMLGFETLLRETLREFYGKNWESKSRKFRSEKFEFKDSNDISRRYTQDQMYYLYNQYKDPASRAAFENMFGKDYARVMKDIENKLEPEVKRFADWQVDVYFPMVYSHYNKTYQKIYRTNMPWNQFYAGRIYRDGITPEPLDLLANSTVYNTAASAASTLLRQNSKAKILPMNGTDALVTYTKDMEYFAAYAETVRDINKIFDNEYIKSAIREIHGDFTLTLIQDMIKKVAAKGIQDSKVAQLLNTMNTAFIFARLGLSPVIMIKQLTSIPTYAADIGAVNWLKYAAKNKTEQIKLWKEVRDNSVYMQDRRNNSILRQIESYSESSKSGFLPQKGLVWAEDFLMWTTKFGDRMAIMLGGLPNYSYYKAEFKKKNPNATEQEAIDHAIIKFERDTKRTQQSSDLQDKDYTQSSAFRSFNMFMTTPKQYLRKEIRSTRNLMRKLKAMDLKAGKGSIQQNAASLLTYHIFMPMLFQYVTNGMPGLLSDWDDEDSSDLLRAAVIGNLNALIITGEIITNIGESIQGKPWAKELTAIPLYDVINELKNKVFGFIDAKTPPKKEKAAYELMEAIAITIGVPAYQVKKALNNYPKLTDSKDYGELILRLLNYSDYQISGPAKKNTRNKKKNKMTQREMKLLFPDLYKDMQELQNPSEIKELEKELRELEKEMLEDLYK